MPRFDTSFKFGENVKPRKPKTARKPAKKRTGNRRGAARGS
jgi:hypothetical protein